VDNGILVDIIWIFTREEFLGFLISSSLRDETDVEFSTFVDSNDEAVGCCEFVVD
jgi:hypothetical protein